MVKLQMKIGGCWRNARTAARYCLVRSYLATARNHGVHPLDAIRNALAGNPWGPTSRLINHRPEMDTTTHFLRTKLRSQYAA